MPRVTVALKDIKDNPFKKHVLGGRLDPTKIATLEASVRQTEFWDNLYGRTNDKGQIELAYGHRRLVAARNVLGDEYETSIKVSPLSDTKMLQAMATENATGEEESTAARIDVVNLARKHVQDFLLPGGRKCACGELLEREQKTQGRQHEPGSEPCVAILLGWSQQKVSELFTLDTRLHPSIKSLIQERVGSKTKGKAEAGTLGQRTASILASLTKDANDTQGKDLQKKIINVLRTSPRRVTDDDMVRIVRTAKQASPARREAVALQETRLVILEAQARATPSPKRDPKKPGPQAEDLSKRMARMLDDMRRIDRACDEILKLTATLGANVLLERRYSTDPIVGYFKTLSGTLAEKFERLFKPVSTAPAASNRRALHA